MWLLTDSFKALALRIALIRNAKKTIRVQTFIWGEDDLSFYLINELVGAAKRGVKVQLLIDGWVGVDNPSLIRILKDINDVVESKHFNPPSKVVCPSFVRLIRAASVNARQMNHRMHAKSFIVDDKWSILGGRNYESRYFGIDPKKFFQDREVLLYGEASTDVVKAFNNFWDSGLSKDTAELTFTYSKDIPEGKKFKRFYRINVPEKLVEPEETELLKLFQDWFKKFSISSFLLREKTTVENVSILYDPPKVTSDKISGSANLILEKVLAAESEIIMQTPYLVFSDKMLSALRFFKEKEGTMNFRFVTNSYGTTDNIIAHLLGLKERSFLYENGSIEIFEFLEDPNNLRANHPITANLCVHSKTMIIDSKYSYVGSSNFDPRSQFYNSEIGMLVCDQGFAGKLKNDINKELETPHLLSSKKTIEEIGYLDKLKELFLALNPSFKPSRIGRTIAYFFRFLIPMRLKNLF